MKQKIQTLLGQLNHGLVEREATLKMALLTVLAGENLVLIGPPGTGKSLIARRIAESLAQDSDDSKDNAYFEYLLTKFSTPEEIFGPLSITELKADRYKRNTAGYLPSVKIAFLDEIFKASSSILNALLTILNERIYHNGAERQAVNMQALIAASNELPTNQEELSALYDRFLVRSFVDYVKPESLPLLFANAGERPKLSTLTIADLESIAESVKTVTIPHEVQEAVLRIWAKHKEIFKEDRREGLSDRRLKKVIHLLSVSAATNGRSQVDLSDVFMLRNCLWNHQENAIKVRDLILNTLHSFSRLVPNNGEMANVISAPVLSQANSKSESVVKGFNGSGTEQDPLLIKNLHDLMGLAHPDVGLKDYYFLQTNNIDCSALSTWIDIPAFKGHYDGGGYTIKYKIENRCYLFRKIQGPSKIINLKFDGLRLSESAADCQISRCVSNVPLIYETHNCNIADCLIVLALCTGNVFIQGGIVDLIHDDSVVERCFVTGKYYKGEANPAIFSGIVSSNYDSNIRQCALGDITLSGWTSWGQRINNYCSKGGTLKDNVAIGSRDVSDANNKSDGPYGKSLDKVLFKQPYFQNTLKWDFDTVWQWDDKEDRPALRSVGVDSSYQQTKSSGQDAKMVDLLNQQMRANIWL